MSPEGVSSNHAGRLINAWVVIWGPVLLVMLMQWIVSGGRISFLDPSMLEAGVSRERPQWDMLVVLVIPASCLLQMGALWWGSVVLVHEFRRLQSHRRQRQRRRRLMEKIWQRSLVGLVLLSMIGSIPVFVWRLVCFYQVAIPKM